MKKWYQIHEQSVGKARLELLWYIYKIFGIRFLKLVIYPVIVIISFFAKPGVKASRKYRKILNKYQNTHGLAPSNFSAVSHIYTFACAMVDKMSASCDKKTKIKLEINKNADWNEFQNLLNNNQGVFLICSHLGNIETLSAFATGTKKTMRAFMQITQNSTFHKFMMRHSITKNTILYPTEDINLSTATQMFEYLKTGDLVMMAGDRISANSPERYETVRFLDTDCQFPVGTFKFARAESFPIFAICLMNIGHENYKIYVKKLDTKSILKMITEYADFLEKLIVKYPKQWFNFFDFFENAE